MAKLTADELIEAFKELTLIELSDFVKKFEEEFDVEAAPRPLSPLPLRRPVAEKPPLKRRPSSTSSSNRPATRRSPSSRKSVDSPRSD